jgi:hypothetical protein
MVEKISVQIALDGADEVKKQLADIGEAGTQAFANIGKAGDSADGIAKVGEASQTAAEGIKQSSAAADKASASMSGLSLESARTGSEIAKNTAEIAKYGVEIGLAIKRHETLIQSLIKLASGANTAAKAVSLLAPELTLVGAGVLAIAVPIIQAAAAFEVLEKVATKFAAADEKLNNTLQTLAATSGKSFDELQRGEAVFGQIGIQAETFRSTVGKINETLAGTDVKNLTKGMSDIVALVKEIAAGQKGITFADWVTAEDKVKGVSIAMKQAADAGKNATQVLLEFLRNADLATSIKVGAAFGLSEGDVERVRNLKENISDLIQRVQGAGPLIGPESAAAFEKMRVSIQNADAAWARFKQSITTTDFAAMAASLSATMNNIKAAVLNGAASITEGFGRAFTGMSQQAGSDVAAIGTAFSELAQQIGAIDLFKQMGTDARNAVTGANAAIASLVGAIMQGMGAAAQSIQAMKDQINGIVPAAQAAGQAAAQAGVMFTSFGTVASQGANTAKKGVEEATVMFTSFGTVASQSAAQADASMQQAAGGATTLATAIQGGSDKAAAFASSLAGITWDTISSTGVAAWNALADAIGDAYDRLLKYIGLRPSAPATGGNAPGGARGGLLFGRGTGSSDSNLAWLSHGEYIMPARAVRQPGVLAFLEALRRSGRIPGFATGGLVGGGGTETKSINIGVDEILRVIGQQTAAISSQSTVIQELGRIIGSLVERVASLVTNVVDLGKQQSELVKGINDLMDALKKDGAAPAGAAAPTGPSRDTIGGWAWIPSEKRWRKLAHGGLLGGRGTGTSDSNLAWVSRGEHIMPARAVRQPGVLEFLELLRRSGGNLRAVLDGMGRFALGGMVPRAIPAFATGGLAGGMSNVTIQFPGLPAIGGLRASSDVVDQLHRAAALAQVRSGGRKPSRYS